MPYVAMAELKWSLGSGRGKVIVKAGDEVGGDVTRASIQRGLVAYLEHVPGELWDERMARMAREKEAKPAEPAAPLAPAAAPLPPTPAVPPGHYLTGKGTVRKIPKGKYLKDGKLTAIPEGYVVHAGEIIKEPRRNREPGEPRPGGERPPQPPTIKEVLEEGYSQEAAAGIVAEEEAKAEAGYPPYGNTPMPSPEVEVAGSGAEGQVPAGPEAPAPALPEDKAAPDEAPAEENKGILARLASAVTGKGDDESPGE
jgi:hypothetical protein